jgi:outer membrane protein assembly factor BamB
MPRDRTRGLAVAPVTRTFKVHLLAVLMAGLATSLPQLGIGPVEAAEAPVWPRFRGPGGMGVSDNRNLPVRFGPEENVIWKTELTPGESSPVIAGDQLFLTGATDEALVTYGLDRHTGRILWRGSLAREQDQRYHKINSTASPTPVTDGEILVVFFGDFGLIAYGLDGTQRWRLPLGPLNNINGHGASPILVDGKVVMVCDQDSGSYMIAVDKDTGRVLWRTERPEVTRGYSTPTLFSRRGESAELIVPGSYQLIAYSLDRGEKLWWLRGMAWQLKSVPLIDGNRIYLNAWESGGNSASRVDLPSHAQVLAERDADGDGRLSLEEVAGFKPARSWPNVDLNKDKFLSERDWEFFRARLEAQNSMMAIRHGGRGDLTDSNVLWRYRKSLPNVASPLLYQSILYLVKDGGIVTTLDPASGEVLKQARLNGATDRYYSSPVGVDDKVYLFSQNGKAPVLKAGGQWEVLALNDLADECYATPAIAGSRLYVRTGRTLYCFGRRP